MAELPVPLSAVALRLAGQVGQTTLDRVAADGAAARAELDQHIAAVRAELAGCQRRPVARGAQQAGLAAGHAADPAVRGQRTGTGAPACPDVPFVSSAVQAEPVVPLRLLLHYTCGFIEAAVRSDWWPAESGESSDWASLRLAAVCQLISQAEAASELHPDLRTLA